MQHLGYILVLVVLFVLCLTNAETHNITIPKSQCDGKERASTLLDVAKDFMNRAKDLYPDCIEDDLHCGRKEKSLAFLDVASNLISEVKINFTNCPKTKCPKILPKPIDCSEILQSGKNESGIYTIWPRSRITPKEGVVVYCDMDTDGGGWTVIQRRGNFSTPPDYFYKDWKSYKMGFGDVNEEFWLGNEYIHAISNQDNYKIRFDLKDAGGVTGYAQYYSFWIEDEHLNYTLRIGGYKGTVGNAMAFHNNQQFSSKDRTPDPSTSYHCAYYYSGSWWYNQNLNKICLHANLNGIHRNCVNCKSNVMWETWRNTNSLAEVEIKLKPRVDS